MDIIISWDTGRRTGKCSLSVLSITIKIYKDHLERDHDNFGTGISSKDKWNFKKFGTTITMNDTWNCLGSTIHAYNGTGNGYTEDRADFDDGVTGAFVNWVKYEYTVPNHPKPKQPINWTTIKANIKRGDVVSFYGAVYNSNFELIGDSLEHAHTALTDGGGICMEQIMNHHSQPLSRVTPMNCLE